MSSALPYMVRQWARDKGITGEGAKGSIPAQYHKLLEEVGELGQALMQEDGVETIDAIGDCTVVLIILADMLGLKQEDCLRSAYDVIKDRKGTMEDGAFVKEV